MSVQPLASPEVKSPVRKLEALLSGRIYSARRVKGRNGAFIITVVKLPAADEFTAPETVELKSATSLGTSGETINVRVRIGGYGRSYQTEDPQTGEKVTVHTADNSLTVVE